MIVEVDCLKVSAMLGWCLFLMSLCIVLSFWFAENELLAQIGLIGEDIRKISKYAWNSCIDNNWDEVYTEYRTMVLLS